MATLPQIIGLLEKQGIRWAHPVQKSHHGRRRASHIENMEGSEWRMTECGRFRPHSV